MALTYNHSTWESKAGGHEFEASLGFVIRPSLKSNKKKRSHFYQPSKESLLPALPQATKAKEVWKMVPIHGYLTVAGYLPKKIAQT